MRHGKPAMMVAALVAAAVSLVWALGPAATTVRAADAQLSPGDVDFLQRLHQVNMTELTFAKWAVDTKTWQGSAAVQAVGKQLQADHTEIDKQTVAMAGQLGVQLPTAPTDQQQWALNTTKPRRGIEFDRAFVTSLTRGHDAAMTLLTTTKAQTKNDAIKQFTDSVMNFVMKHVSLLDATNEGLTADDQTLLGALQQASIFETTTGKWAQAQSGNKMMQAIGQVIVQDHTRLEADVKVVSDKYDYPIPSAPNPTQQGWLDKEKGQTGGTFDNLALTFLMTGHHKALDLLKKVNASTKNEDIKQLAESTIQMASSHVSLMESQMQAMGADMQMQQSSGFDFRDRRVALSALAGGFAVLLATLLLRGLMLAFGRRRRESRYMAS